MNRREPDQQFTPDEIAQRRDAMLLRLLKTPPKPRAEMTAKTKPDRTGRVTAKKRSVNRGK